MSTKRGPLIVSAAAVFAYFMLFRSAAEPSQPVLFAETVRLQHQGPKPSALTQQRSRVQPRLKQIGPAPVPRAAAESLITTPQPTIAGSGAPSSARVEHAVQGGQLIELSQLETEHDFQALTAAMEQASSPEAEEKQRAYEADFAAFPEAARGVSVKHFRCDEHNCIGQISAKHQEDIDQFMLTAAQSARYPIYTAQLVDVDDSSEALRRFAISTDPNLAALPMPN